MNTQAKVIGKKFAIYNGQAVVVKCYDNPEMDEQLEELSRPHIWYRGALNSDHDGGDYPLAHTDGIITVRPNLYGVL